MKARAGWLVSAEQTVKRRLGPDGVRPPDLQMVLVDSSIWIDHLRLADERLISLLDRSAVLSHPFVTGELALGSLRQRAIVIVALRKLPQAVVARDDEVLTLIEQRQLFGLGLGYVDAHLLASVMLTPDARLWSRDRRLHEIADRFGLAEQVH